jgi:hypothetical protein
VFAGAMIRGSPRFERGSAQVCAWFLEGEV